MLELELTEAQLDVVDRLSNGKILYGGVGAGKSIAVLEYYMRKECPRNIYVITTAKKRDTLDWEKEAINFGISTDPELSFAGTITIDSWNNIEKYVEVEDAFFIFDEQRVIGYGAWTKNFLKIAKKNRWVLLSATPGDTWTDYAPVFIANGYFKNITDFRMQHVVYEPRVHFPKVRVYLRTDKLERLRNEVLVEMPYVSENKRVLNWMPVGYDVDLFREVWVKRWNVYEDRPIKDAAERFRLARKVINSDYSRLDFVWDLITKGIHDKIIVFYNWDYELAILRTMSQFVMVCEWNGHKKEPLPNEGPWLYLVQYQSGAEGWNCTTANAMVFYSMTRSYRNFEQAQGRIDRFDTPFNTLYYYVLMSDSIIDKANKRALEQKKDFNESKFMKRDF